MYKKRSATEGDGRAFSEYPNTKYDTSLNTMHVCIARNY